MIGRDSGMSDDDFANYQKMIQQKNKNDIEELERAARSLLEEYRNKPPQTMWNKIKIFLSKQTQKFRGFIGV